MSFASQTIRNRADRNSTWCGTRADVWWLIAAAFLAGITSGCGSTISHNGRGAESCRPSRDNLAGNWEGTWESREHGFRRSVRASIAPSGKDEYHGQYDVMFGAAIPRNYEFVHATVEQSGATCFRGEVEHYLGIAGTCHCAGRSDGAMLVINYVSGKDFGVIRLRRSTVENETSIPQAFTDAFRELIR